MTKEETDVWRMTYCVAFASSSSERASDARGPYTSNIYHSIRAANTARRAVAGLNGLLHDEDPEHRAAAAAVLGTDGAAL